MRIRLAIAGVGNNASALVQGFGFYRSDRGKHLPGVSRPTLKGIGVTDTDIVAAFDVAANKAGKPLSKAIFESPNNYPQLDAPPLEPDPSVSMGIEDATNAEQVRSVSAILRQRGVEVLLYSLPTGLPAIARAYAEASLAAGVAVVNCTPDPIAGLPDLLDAAKNKGIPLLGDDLQSHFGSSVVHGALLALFEDRGVKLNGSYQLNCGGNADFANLRQRSAGKESSKHNALRQKVRDTSQVTVVPSAAFVPFLEDRKVGVMSFEGRGWNNMPIKLDVTLQVQDSSNAAGVIIDLIRIAAIALRSGEGGFPIAATPLLKSPPIIDDPQRQAERARELLAALAGRET